MKRLVIILVLDFLLAGGGAGWWFFLRDDDSAAEEAGVEPEPGMNYVEVDPLNMPVIREGRVVRHMIVLLVLEVPEGDANRIVFRAMRRLKDAYIYELHTLFSRRFVWENDRLVDYVKRRVMAASEKVVGPDVVHSVLIRGIQTGVENSN